MLLQPHQLPPFPRDILTMSFADVNHVDARHCTFQNVGRNLINITFQVFPPPSEPSSPSSLSTAPQIYRLTDTSTLSSVSNTPNSHESLITLLHARPSSLHLITAITHLLNVDFIPKRDFLRDLPITLALRVLRFINNPRTLVHMCRVSKHWRSLLSDKHVWRRMCVTFGFDVDRVEAVACALMGDDDPNGKPDRLNKFVTPMDPALRWLVVLRFPHLKPAIISMSIPHHETFPPSKQLLDRADATFSYRKCFKSYYDTTGIFPTVKFFRTTIKLPNLVLNWRRAARLVCPCLPVDSQEGYDDNDTVVPDGDCVLLESSQNADHEIG
jgi:hypothetical protein